MVQTVVKEADRLWTTCSAQLRDRVPEASWQSLFGAVRPVSVEDGCLVLAVPSGLAKERIESRYLPLVEEILEATTGAGLQVRLAVESRRPEPAWTDDRSSPRRLEQPELSFRPAAPAADEDTPLIQHYTFDGFVIGASNRFAHAAARAVAETPAKSYNPLFIHGNAGLGKTHLLHAIGNYVVENFPALRVRYVSTETYMNEFVDAIRKNTAASFKRRYRECDVLLIDDIQFMETRQGLQEEFFHNFNSLHGASKQIVITSDRPPKSIATLEERLQSRFLWGLITDIQPPDIETRLAILRKKAEGEPSPVPDQVLEFIATHVKENTRELEGALNRVSAYAHLNGHPLTRELAEKVLTDIVASEQPRTITPQIIIEATAAVFGFTVEELCGTSRRRPLVTARQVGMYVCRDLTDFSYPAIAREFGGRDHTTVIHAVEKIAALMKERHQIYDQVTELTHLIKSGG